MAAPEIPIAGFRTKLLSRSGVAEGTMAFHFVNPDMIPCRRILFRRHNVHRKGFHPSFKRGQKSFLCPRGTQRASAGVAIFDNGLQFLGQHLKAGMHVFSDFAFNILELRLQTLLLSGRESLLR